MNENISNNSSNQPEKPKTFSDQCRIWFRGFGETCSRFLLKIGLTANTVTIIGCAGHIIAAYLAAMGQFTWAGILLVFFAVTDFFDGTMARLSTGGKGTRFGAVLDSCTDRYAEFFIFGGLIYYYAVHEDYLTMMVAYIAIMGSILVSYTRAKGEIERLDMKLGIMSRLERYLFLVPCLLFKTAETSVLDTFSSEAISLSDAILRPCMKARTYVDVPQLTSRLRCIAGNKDSLQERLIHR